MHSHDEIKIFESEDGAAPVIDDPIKNPNAINSHDEIKISESEDGAGPVTDDPIKEVITIHQQSTVTH